MQRVVDLLRLKATCPVCENALIDTGVGMRQQLDDFRSYIASIWLTGYLEDRVGGRFTNDEIDQVKTLRGLATLVETRLAPNDRAGPQAIELVEWAMEQLHNDPFWERRGPHIRTPPRAASLNFDVSLIDAIDPGRWDRD
jgi:hypothetical protein